jgi:uracil permease
MEKGNKTFMDVNETPSLGKWIPLSLQHLFAMFGATVLVPLLTGLNIQVALLASGLGTLLFLALTKGKVPNYLGSSFAFIGPIITVSAQHGFGAAMLGCFLAGLVYVVIAGIVSKAGIGWINKVLPPVVIGSVIVVIGLSLSGVAVNWAIKLPSIAWTGEGPAPYSLQSIEVAFVTLAVTTISLMFFRGFLSVIPILSGIVVGYLYSFLRYPEWINTSAIANSNWFWNFTEEGNTFQDRFLTDELFLAFGDASAWLAALVIVPVAFVTLAEHIGHLLVTGRVMNRDLVKNPGLHRTLLGDGLATSLAAFLGGPPNTTYGENIGVLALTRVYSRNVILLAAVFAIILSFVEKLGAVLGNIPTPVLGGVTIVLFGVIASQGLRMFVEHGIDFAHKRNLLLTAIILVTGIGGFKLEFAELKELNFSFTNFIANLTIDNIAMATFLGILLHVLLPGKESAYGQHLNE